MTKKEKQMLRQRLSELFAGETQSITANKLHTTQGNISKWINGQSVPPTETIYDISRQYNVSIDWILGVSDRKNIDSISYDQITYEQVFCMIDRLLRYRNLIIADLNEIYEDLKRKREKEEAFAGSGEEEKSYQPEYNSDYIKIHDRLLSYLFRKRMKAEAVDPDIMEMWKERKIPDFGRLRVIDNTGNMEAALDTRGWPRFEEGDWIDSMEELSKMTEEERAKLIEKNSREKKDGENGRKKHS